MILGMSVPTFTLVHVILSLVGILAGLIVVARMFGSNLVSGWAALFLATTVLTSVTGFFFPRDQILPSHVVGIISLVLLAVALFALYARHVTGPWRWAYVATAVASLYLNVFVAIVQAFQKIAPLHALAPTQTEPAFVVVQAIVLLLFVGIGIFAVRAFHPQAGFGETSAA